VDSLYFVVTTPAAEVSSGEDRRAEFLVSITNVTGRATRASLQLVPSHPAAPDWFTVVAGPEREFALGETESYTVEVQVPATVPGGSYSVRCDAVSEDQPQEAFTSGPTVAIAVPAATRKKRFPKWILALIAGIIVVAVIATLLVARSGGEKVPDVTGVAGSQSIVALANVGLEANPPAVDVAPCDAPVATQDPPAGAEVDGGSTVNLTFADCGTAAPFIVPDLLGLAALEIGSLLNPGFDIQVVQIDEARACNPTVAAQSPPPGTRTKPGAVVLLAIPAEPAGCDIVSALRQADPSRLAFFETAPD